MVADLGKTHESERKQQEFDAEMLGTSKRNLDIIINGLSSGRALVERGIDVATLEAMTAVAKQFTLSPQEAKIISDTTGVGVAEVEKNNRKDMGPEIGKAMQKKKKELVDMELKLIEIIKKFFRSKSTMFDDVVDHTSSKEHYDECLKVLKIDDPTAIQNVRNRIEKLKVSNFNTPKEYFDRLDQLIDDLKLCQDPISDPAIIAKVLDEKTDWPEAYKPFTEAFMAASTAATTYKDLKAKMLLRHETLVIRDETKEEIEESANFAGTGDRGTNIGRRSRGGERRRGDRGKPRDRGGRSSNYHDAKKGECYRCGDIGHQARTCRAPQEACDAHQAAKDGNFEAEIAAIQANLTTLLNKRNNKYTSTYKSVELIVDSGTTKTLVNDKDLITNEKILNIPKPISTAEAGAKIYATSTGNMELNSKDNKVIVLTGVHLVPELNAPLLSVREMAKNGFTTTIGPNDAFISDETGDRLATLQDKNGLYVLEAQVPGTSANIATDIITEVKATEDDHTHAHPREVVEEEEIEIDESQPLCVSCKKYHDIFVHFPNRVIRRTSTMVTGMPDLTRVISDIKSLCPGCMKGKMKRRPFVRATDKDRMEYGPGEKAHIDLRGPYRVPALGTKSKYSLAIIDENTSYGFNYQLKKKDHAKREIKDWITQHERQTGKKLKVVMIDKGGELKALEPYLKSLGIQVEDALAYQHEQNGLVEKFNRDVMEGALSMIYGSNAPISLWGAAANHFVHVRNLTPQKGKNITRYEAYHGIRPDVRHLHPFFAPAWIQVPIQRRQRSVKYKAKGKLSEKSSDGMVHFVGVRKGGALFYDPKENKIVEAATSRFEKTPDYIPIGEKKSLEEFTEPEKKHQQRKNPRIDYKNSFEHLESEDDDEEEPTLYDNDEELPPELETESNKEPTDSDNDEDSSMNDSPLRPAAQLKKTTKENDAEEQIFDVPISKIDLSEGKHHIIGDTNAPRLTRSSVPKEHPQAPKKVRVNVRPKEKTIIPLSERMQMDSSRGYNSVPLLDDEKMPESMQGGDEELEDLHSFMSTERDDAEGKIHAAFDKIQAYFTTLTLPDIPKSLKAAMKSENWPQWKKAIEIEMNAHEINGTWELVDLPKGKHVIGSKMIFDLKLEDGKLSTARYPFKARYVARGDQQGAEIDFKDRFAPTAKANSNRILFTLAAIYDWEVRSFDVSTAYLHGEQKHEVYMKPLSGLLAPGDNRVCKLLKGLYGTVDGGKRWYIKLKNYLKGLGFDVLVSDNSVYIRGKGKDIMIISVSTDDCLVFGPDLKQILAFEEEFNKMFKTTSQGSVRHHLGIEITRDRKNRKFYFHQRVYIEEMLKKFEMENCKPASTPLPADIYSQLEKEEKFNDNSASFPYLELLGSLLYLAIQTRPDISAAVGIMGQYSSHPKPVHWYYLKRILAYIKGTKDKVFRIGGNSKNPFELIGYADSDWAGNPQDSKSRSGLIFFINDSTVSSGSFKQSTVALSSTEAERNAAHEAAKEGCSIRKFLEEIAFPQRNATKIFGDNTGCVAQIYNDVQSKKSKHMMLKYNFAKEKVESNELKWEHIRTTEMIADIFTKALPRDSFEKFRDAIGVVNMEDPHQPRWSVGASKYGASR